jgi:hypothetical protein
MNSEAGPNSIRLIQLSRDGVRRVAVVEEPHLRLLADVSSIYRLAIFAISGRIRLTNVVRQRLTPELLDYDAIHNGESEWTVLPAMIIQRKLRGA